MVFLVRLLGLTFTTSPGVSLQSGLALVTSTSESLSPEIGVLVFILWGPSGCSDSDSVGSDSDSFGSGVASFAAACLSLAGGGA